MDWKIRYDLLQYAGRGVPALPLDELKAYQPKKALSSPLPGKKDSCASNFFKNQCLILSLFSISEILSRLHDFAPLDDGHAVKLSRAAVITQQISENYNDRDWKIIKGDDMWMRIHHLIADSVEAPGPKFVRTAGLDEAWIVSISFAHHSFRSFQVLIRG